MARKSYVPLKVAAAALIVTACGSSGGGSTSGSGSANAPIKIETINDLSGNAAVYPTIPEAANVAAEAINKAGGIQGHKIVLISCDAQRDPNVTASCGRQAVADHAVALVGNEIAAGGQYVPITTAAGIPDVAVEPNATIQMTGKLEFPFTAGTGLDMVGAGQVCVKTGNTKIKGAYLNTPLAEALLKDYLPLGLKQTGVKVAGLVPVSLTQTDYAPIAAALMAGGTNCVAAVITEAEAPLLVQALHRAGYKGAIILDAAYEDSLAQSLHSAADGTWFVGGVLPLNDTSDPGVRQYLSEFKAAGKIPVGGTLAISAWAGVHLVAQLLQHAHAIDSKSLVAALRKLGPTTIGPLAPFDFSKRDSFVAPPVNLYTSQVVVTQIENSENVIRSGGFASAFDIPRLSQ